MHLFFDTVWKLHIGEIPEKPHEFIDEIEQYDIWEEYRNEIAVIKQNALTVDNEEIIGDVIDKLRITNHCGTDFYKWIGSCFKTDICSKGDRCTGSDLTCEGHPIWVAILTLPEERTLEEMDNDCANAAKKLIQSAKSINLKVVPEEKKNTMENIVEREFKQTGEIITDIVGDFFKRVTQDPKDMGIEVKEFENSDTRLSLLKRDDRTIAGVVETRTEFNNVEFIKFSLYKDHPTTASGSVAAPKEEIFVDGDFNDSYEARVKRATGKNMIISKEHYTALREALKELLPIAQWGYDLLVPFDKKGMGREWPAIIERARNLLSK